MGCSLNIWHHVDSPPRQHRQSRSATSAHSSKSDIGVSSCSSTDKRRSVHRSDQQPVDIVQPSKCLSKAAAAIGWFAELDQWHMYDKCTSRGQHLVEPPRPITSRNDRSSSERAKRHGGNTRR